MIDMAPEYLDGARVVAYALVGMGQHPTAATAHSAPGVPEAITAVALARYEDEADVYLFYCNREWDVMTDTCHSSVEEALAQATFEFAGLEFRANDLVHGCWGLVVAVLSGGHRAVWAVRAAMGLLRLVC